MSDPVDQGSADAAEPLEKCCSFCLKSSKEVDTLIEGPKRGELGAAYICEECIKFCGMVFANPMRRVAETERGAAESPPGRQAFQDTVDAASRILRRLQSRNQPPVEP
jgi:ClpX C4-type zinc finger